MSNKPNLRCRKCGKVLARGIIKEGIVEIKCKKCGTYNIFQVGFWVPPEASKGVE